jgi:hypothetical protein
MKHIYFEARKEEEEFVLKAAKYFKENLQHNTFTEADIVPGCWFAMRWGLNRNGVLVFKLDEFSEPTNYMEIIK